MFAIDEIDPAAVFAIAISIWHECNERTSAIPGFNLSDAYDGIDGLMREIMRIAVFFESWACGHVDFTQLNDVWPYLLEDRFAEECLSILLPENLREFDEHDCRRIAARLRLICI